jgi:hypothetical protein
MMTVDAIAKERTWTKEDRSLLYEVMMKMGLCGCGTDVTSVIRMLLEKGEDHDAHGSYYDPDDAPLPWIEFGAKVLDSWGLTEHGTGIGWAWLTNKGILLLRYYREFGEYDEKHDEMWLGWWEGELTFQKMDDGGDDANSGAD